MRFGLALHVDLEAHTVAAFREVGARANQALCLQPLRQLIDAVQAGERRAARPVGLGVRAVAHGHGRPPAFFAPPLQIVHRVGRS